MYPRTEISEAQWHDAFEHWDAGMSLTMLARRLHVDERRLITALKTIDAERYARIKSAHASHGHLSWAERPKGRRRKAIMRAEVSEMRPTVHGEVRGLAMMTASERDAIEARWRLRHTDKETTDA